MADGSIPEALTLPELFGCVVCHRLTEMGFEKLVNEVDAKEAARLGLVSRPLTEVVVQKQLDDLGLEAAFGTHSQIRGLSGVKL